MSCPAEVRIRRMRAGDVERVMEIASFLREAPHWSSLDYVAALDPLHLPRRIVLIAADAESDAAAGFLVASLVTPEAELETISVAQERQRCGVGARLLSALVGELKTERVTELRLEVRASNGAALQFYRGQGFNEAGRRARYYADPEEDAMLMEMRLI